MKVLQYPHLVILEKVQATSLVCGTIYTVEEQRPNLKIATEELGVSVNTARMQVLYAVKSVQVCLYWIKDIFLYQILIYFYYPN